jgi:hypothetical protein
MTAASKTAVFLELRAHLTARSLDLYEHPDLLAELRRLRTRYAAGSASVVNPRVGGSHGDLAQALALAVWEARKGVGYMPGGIGVGGKPSDLVRSLAGGGHRDGQLTSSAADDAPGLSYDDKF